MKETLLLLIFFTMIGCRSHQLAIVKQNGKYGCINRKGQFVIQPRWDWVLYDSYRKLILVESDSNFGYVNNRDKIVIPIQYKEAALFQDGLAAVSNGKKYGFINRSGDTIIPFVYDDVDFGFSEGLSDVSIGDCEGYINKKGEIVIPIKYHWCYPFKSGYAQLSTLSGDEYFVDKKGNLFDWDSINPRTAWPPKESYPGSIETCTGQGRVNREGDTVVPPIYRVTGNLTNGHYIVQKDAKWGVYNRRGKLLFAPQFDYLWHFSEGYANFYINKKWGYISKRGKIAIAAQFDNASSFKHGLAYVELNGKAGFINKKGKFVIAPKFEPDSEKVGFK